MLLDLAALLGVGRLLLLRQAVLQLGHAQVHGEGGLAQRAALVLGPLQHLAGRQAAHHRHQHGVRGAVHAQLAAGQVGECKQGAVGVALGVQVELAMQFVQTLQKIGRVFVAQHGVGLLLQRQPVGFAVNDFVTRIGRLKRRKLAFSNLPQRNVVLHQFAQLVDIGAAVRLGLGHIHKQLAALQNHLLQVRLGTHHIALGREQHAPRVAQRKGQRKTDADSVCADSD